MGKNNIFVNYFSEDTNTFEHFIYKRYVTVPCSATQNGLGFLRYLQSLHQYIQQLESDKIHMCQHMTPTTHSLNS